MQRGYSHALHTHIYIEYARHGEIQGCSLALGTFGTWHLALGTFGTWHFWHLAFGNCHFWHLALATFGTWHFWLADLFLSNLLFAKWHFWHFWHF